MPELAFRCSGKGFAFYRFIKKPVLGGEEEVCLSPHPLTARSTLWEGLGWTSGFPISREVGNEKYSTKITPNFGY